MFTEARTSIHHRRKTGMSLWRFFLKALIEKVDAN
jgi:hypothetical protein